MQCTNPILIKHKSKASIGPEMQVPCGKCTSCKIRRVSEWKLRMMHELDSYIDSSFITLTYSDKYLPENQSLKKRDLQLFFKRLRKSLNKKIRYFACGEYGDQTNRPHYHVIMFGLGLSDFDKQKVMDSWTYADWSVRSIYKNAFGLVEPESVQYVAGYMFKQYDGDLAEDVYKKNGREVPFKLMSLGLGRDYCDKNIEQIKNLGYITINGIKMSIPRYYINRLELDMSVIKKRAIEKDSEIIHNLTGLSDLSSRQAYMSLSNQEVERIEHAKNMARRQRDNTVKTKVNMYKKKL